jgi:hypothetical protein
LEEVQDPKYRFSRVERTHLGSSGTSACSSSKDSSGGMSAGRGGFSSSLSSFEEETRIGIEEGITVEDGSQAKEGTTVELGLQAKRFSSNLTSLLRIISLQCG